MPPASPRQGQVNGRVESPGRRLALALAVSLAVHAVIYTGWRQAPALRAAVKSVLELVVPKRLLELQARKEEAPKPQPKRETPLVFVQVDPAMAAKEPPKETKNYSTHDSVAANPTPKQALVPKIDGSQTHVIRTMDVPKPQPQPLEPTPPPVPVQPKRPEPKVAETKPPEPKPETKPAVEPKPQPKPEIGDLVLAKPTPKPPEPARTVEVKPEEKPYEKPRTLKEAMQRNPALAGQKMLQEGGVVKHAQVSMLDAKGSVFGNYDNVFISMVQQRWYDLLENNRFMLDRHGKVGLTFRLHYDGRITRLETEENSVGDVLGLLCQKAVLDPAPFPKWPTEMRQRVGTDYRDVKFTFFYD